MPASVAAGARLSKKEQLKELIRFAVSDGHFAARTHLVMGGAACRVGNVTPAAEYNMWCDPEAARIVFHSGLPIEMVGWELCRGEANLREDDMQSIRKLDTPLAHFTLDCNQAAIKANFRQSGEVGLALPDPVAMSIALDPSICTRKSRHFVDIETRSELTRGMTVVDALEVVGWAAARPPPSTN